MTDTNHGSFGGNLGPSPEPEQLELFGVVNDDYLESPGDPHNEFLGNLGYSGLEGLAARLHHTSVEKGFYDYDEINFEVVGLKLALVHSEVTEILEALRKDKGSVEVAKEFADAHIRLLDLWAALKDSGLVDETTDLDEQFALKANFNKSRPQRHGVKF